MRKKFLVLLLSIVMVFIMSVPTFAIEAGKQETLMMTALGDSIASGCTNINFVFDGGAGADQEEDFREFVQFKDGKKNYDCNKVKLSFVSKLYRELGANEYSKNLAFVGLRSKDFCKIVGIDPVREGDYESDFWWQIMSWACGMGTLGNEYNTQVYKSAIKHSDVIVVQLGENDLTSALLNHYQEIEELFTSLAGLMPQGSEERLAVNKLAKNTAELNDALTGNGNSFTIGKIVERINSNIEELINLGKGIEEIVSGLLDIVKEMTIQNRYYFKSMMNYIDKNSKPGAVVVAGTIINPFEDMASDSSGLGFMLGDAAGLTQIMNLVIGPFVKSANSYIRRNAVKYGYKVADISDVSVNPGEPYMLHPNEEGQQTICDRYAKVINKALTNSRRAKLGIETDLKNVKEATYLEDGYTGDLVCKDCGEVLYEGSSIAKLVLGDVNVASLKSGKNAITVNWNTASDADGYELQVSTSAEFDKNVKKVSVNSATTAKAVVKKLKSGKNYYVRIRAYKKVANAEGQMVNVYSSNWSVNKSIKTK